MRLQHQLGPLHLHRQGREGVGQHVVDLACQAGSLLGAGGLELALAGRAELLQGGAGPRLLTLEPAERVGDGVGG
ncbi:MAG: hypothetical protein ABSC16_13455 [Candidatus Dormibacteria bacterium]